MSHRFKNLFANAAMAGALALGLLGPPGAAVAQSWEDDPTLVPMFQNAFLRLELTVPIGATVTWVNWDGEVHDVVERNSLLFSSPLVNTGETWQLTFDAPGVYQYVCDLHANMEGVVVVG